MTEQERAAFDAWWAAAASPEATPEPAIPTDREEATAFIDTLLERAVGVEQAEQLRQLLAATPAQAQQAEPIDMVLHCPACGLQHIDRPDERSGGWVNAPHRSHLCHGCGHIWRPADVPTNGVKAVNTRGKADSPTAPAQAQQAQPVGYVAAEIYSAWRKVGADTAGLKWADFVDALRAVMPAPAPEATPAMAQQAEAKPLTAMQARSVVDGMGWALNEVKTEDMEMLVKAAERACAEAWGVKLAGIGASTVEAKP